MQKRGQISTFLIIGIVILAVVGMVLYFRSAQISQVPKEAVAPEAQPIQTFVSECIQRTAIPGIFFLGEQGGYINTPANSFDTDLYSIAYGSINHQNSLPSLDTMQNELSSYLQQFLPLCTNGFQDFRKQGININESSPTVQTRIFQNEVMFIVDYPITVARDGKETKMQNFVENIPIRLGNDYSIAEKIVNENKGDVVLNKLIFPGVKVNLLPAGAGTLVFGIVDEKSRLSNRTFLFMFASQISDNQNPTIETIYNPVFKSGESISLQANAEDPDGDPITFSTNSTQFGINPDTGEIITTAPIQGSYPVLVMAEDGKGGFDEQKVIFRIV